MTISSSCTVVTGCFSLVDATDDRGQQQQHIAKKWDIKYLEELLKETHGGDLYNYWTGDDV